MGSMELALQTVRKLARKCGCSADRMADIEISMREAVANAIIHGNERQQGRRILIRAYGDPQLGLLITVRDDGPGFDPDSVPDPRSEERLSLGHGRGIFLMRELMDHVEHRRGGSEVRMFVSCNHAGSSD
jgi:serine/threonine-protein kinase RsbW